MPQLKKTTKIERVQAPASGSREPRYDHKVDEEAKQILTPTNKEGS
jgi:hypothetical protein